MRHDHGVLTASEELSAGPVRLRRWRTSDADALYRAVRESIEDLAPWMPWAAQGYSDADAAAYIANARGGGAPTTTTRSSRPRGPSWAAAR